MLEYLLPSII